MLSEGWDAKTVTHIMGLRAFASQLLCEQVVGRGLRRTAYEVAPDTGLFEPEYVNVFGVPFTFLPHEGGENGPPPPPEPKTAVEPDRDKAAFENPLAERHPHRSRVPPAPDPRLGEGGAADPRRRPDRPDRGAGARRGGQAGHDHAGGHRPGTSGAGVPHPAHRLRDRAGRVRRDAGGLGAGTGAGTEGRSGSGSGSGSREVLLAQLVRLVEQFVRSDRIVIEPRLFAQDDLKRRLMLALNMTRVVQHIWQAIRFENTERLTPVFDRDRPIRSTGDMVTWYTGRPCDRTARSHINFCVHDSTWEASEAHALDHSPLVDAWVKNDHLGFEVFYVHAGVVHK